MMKKFEVERLLRAYGRKSHDHVVESYLEFVREFDSVDVRKAVDHALSKNEKLPVPADLRKLASIGKQPDSSFCDKCQDKGYWLVGADYEYDPKGFRVIGHGLPVRCRCGQTPPMMEKRWVTGVDIKHWSIARLLAQVLAERAQKSSMVDTMEQWRAMWWQKSEIKDWVEIAKSIDSLRVLVRMSELIDGADPDDCAEGPKKLCKRILPSAVSLKNEKGIINVYQGVRI